jgi:hypothetical protein
MKLSSHVWAVFNGFMEFLALTMGATGIGWLLGLVPLCCD